MASSRGLSWLVAFLYIAAAVPVSFYLGVGAMVALQVLRGPGPGGGEGTQAYAYTALLFGGPIGVLIGTALAGWCGLRLTGGGSWPLIIGTLAVLVAASAWAVHEMGPA